VRQRKKKAGSSDHEIETTHTWAESEMRKKPWRRVMQTSRIPTGRVAGRSAGFDWTRQSVKDAVAIFGLACMAYLGAKYFALFDVLARLQSAHRGWAIDDVALICIVLSVALAAYAWRRLQDVTQEATARRAAEAEVGATIERLNDARRFLDAIVENVPAVITVKELPDFRYALINRQGERWFGIPRERILGKTAADIYPKATADIVEAHDRALLASTQPTEFGEHSAVTPHNGTRVIAASGVPIPGADGKPQYVLNVVQDVTDRKRAEARIEHLAHHDSLTDLPNRTAFNECLQATIEKAAAEGTACAVLCLDLDRFKEVNDLFGHAVGDGLLCEIAKRLQAVCEGAFLARLGGDEFAIICADRPQPFATEVLAEAILRAVEGDLEIGGQVLQSGLSIGVAIYPTDGIDGTVLLANADAALYRAKVEARGSIRFFAPEMDQRLRRKRALQHELRAAVARGELSLQYQPQASIAGEVVGFEALARWHSPTLGTVPPGEFIPLAEESGLIVSVGEWILREACREAASWPRALRVAVNLSPVQFRQGDLPALVHSVLLETGLAAGRLEIEITEGVLVDDFSRAVGILRRLKSLGVRIAMDDFGTGYSSLSYLQAFPFDKIKIDQTFIANLERSPQSAAIVRAVIGLGRGLELPIVAEGVETKSQLAFLAREACDEVQGYLIGRPQPIENYSELVGRVSKPGALALAS
jgi:diguanylate cyclase (GGDEF)-like protein/PAS domain S-box-containing protein